MLVAGAGIAFASGALNDRTERQPPQPTPAPIHAPVLLVPSATLTRAATTDVSGTLPDAPRAGTYVLRVYVNEELARERPAPADASFTITSIPLQEGPNEITAALATSEREGDRSAPMTVTRDSTSPVIRVARPSTDAPVYSPTETLRGRTEPGSDLEVEMEATGETVAATTAADGRFEVPIDLEMGENTFTLRSQDPAGNRAITTLVLTRMVSLASIEMDLSVAELAPADLPATVAVVAHIRDEFGAAAEDADVTFSVSPPNRATTTYRTVSSRGVARWPALTIAGDQRAVGTWLVTVLVLLPSGEELREDASIFVAE